MKWVGALVLVAARDGLASIAGRAVDFAGAKVDAHLFPPPGREVHDWPSKCTTSSRT